MRLNGLRAVRIDALVDTGSLLCIVSAVFTWQTLIAVLGGLQVMCVVIAYRKGRRDDQLATPLHPVTTAAPKNGLAQSGRTRFGHTRFENPMFFSDNNDRNSLDSTDQVMRRPRGAGCAACAVLCVGRRSAFVCA